MRARRKLAIVLVVASAAFATYVFVEMHRGTERLEAARAAYIADGGSFDPTTRFAKPVPDEDNFGATPALNGITADTPAGEALRETLEQLGLKATSHRLPVQESLRRHPHEPRARRDFADLGAYFSEHSLLDIPPEKASSEEAIFIAIEARFGDLISELSEASKRPEALLLPLKKDRYAVTDVPFFKTDPELQTLDALARGIRLHSVLALRSNRLGIAFDDIRVMDKLASATQSDRPTVIGFLIGNAISSMNLETIWEGLADRRWTVEQLKTIEMILSRRPFVHELEQAIHTELVDMDRLLIYFNTLSEDFGNDSLHFSKFNPLRSAWISHNRAELIEHYHQEILAQLGLPNGYIRARNYSVADAEAMESRHSNPRSGLAVYCAAYVSGMIEKFAMIEAMLAQAVTACALERYYVNHQTYPETLQELVPNFLSTLPLDPINRSPMRYRQTTDGRYQLHGIGIDEKDNAGGEGDITWNFEEPIPVPVRMKGENCKNRKRPKRTSQP